MNRIMFHSKAAIQLNHETLYLSLKSANVLSLKAKCLQNSRQETEGKMKRDYTTRKQLKKITP